MKLIPFFITGLLNVAVGAILFLFLLSALNGFSSKQAQPGLILFIGSVLLISLIAAILSGVAAKFLIEKKAWHFLTVVLIVIPIFVTMGAVVSVITLAISIAVADALR